MILNVDITATKNVNGGTIAQATLILAQGELTNLQLIIPTGHVGLTRTVFFYQGHQIWPLVTGSFRGNGSHIIVNPKLQIDTQPRELTIQLTNFDDSYVHTVYAIIEVDTQSGEGISVTDLIELGINTRLEDVRK